MSDNKTAGQKLWENLSYNCPNVWNKIGNDEIKNNLCILRRIQIFFRQIQDRERVCARN